MHWIPSELRS